MRDFKELFLMLWYHGTFPLSFLTYAVLIALLIGFGLGKI